MSSFNSPAAGNEISCQFIVRKVYGTALIGDIIPTTGGPAPTLQNSTITLEEIVDNLRPEFNKHPIIRDLTNYFLTGDRFDVQWHRIERKITNLSIDFERLRDRCGESVTVTKTGIVTKGYVINENQNGLLIWTKLKNGYGALAFAPKISICAEELRHGVGHFRSALNFPAVGILMEKTEIQQQGPQYAVVSYECFSVHMIKDNGKNSYFPAYSVDGVMFNFLGDLKGAVLDTYSCKVATTNPNRPEPQPGDKIYCPPWAFLMESSRPMPPRWQEFCRLGNQYNCSAVFVKERGPAFDCYWIALGVKLVGDLRSVQQVNDNPAEKYLTAYETYRQTQSKISDWDADDARGRIGQQLVEDGEEGAGDGDTVANCRMMTEVWRNRRPQRAAARADVSSTVTTAAIGGARMRRVVSSRASQTTVDNEYFNETRAAYGEMARLLDPSKLEEFYVRFSEIQRVFK